MQAVLCYLIAGWSGFFVMAVELLGGRLLAPTFGSSIYVWGAIITVFMLALSLGYLAGGRFSIIVVAEGARDKSGAETILGDSLPGQDRRVGGIAQRLVKRIQEMTGKETRSMVLGHLQRGGMPTGYDRLLATRFGGAAAQAVADGKWGHMVALQTPNIVTVPIAEALLRPTLWISEIVYVPLETPLLKAARRVGCRFADGGHMNVGQAARGFRLFTGLEPDAERMEAHFRRLAA